MNNSDTEKFFNTLIAPLSTGKIIIPLDVSITNGYGYKHVKMTTKISIYLVISNPNDKLLVKNSFKEYLGKFTKTFENITCYFNASNQRVSVVTGFDSSKRLTDNPYTNPEMIEALQILIDFTRKF